MTDQQYVVIMGDDELIRQEGIIEVSGQGTFESISEARKFADLDYEMYQVHDEDDLGPYPDLVWDNLTGATQLTVFGIQYCVILINM